MTKSLYNKKEACELLGVGKTRLNRMISDGGLESGGGLITSVAIERILGHPIGEAPAEVGKNDPAVATLEAETAKLNAAASKIQAEIRLSEIKGLRDKPAVLAKRETEVEKREVECQKAEGQNEELKAVWQQAIEREKAADNLIEELNKVRKDLADSFTEFDALVKKWRYGGDKAKEQVERYLEKYLRAQGVIK